MKIFVTSFWSPKAGNAVTEYEDAFYPKKNHERNGKQLRWAIADGASEGMLSGSWAEILVKTFCRSNDSTADTNDFLKKAFEAWILWKTNYLRDRERRHKPIRWYEESGLQLGAFSTLLGLTFQDAVNGWTWYAWALGDSCLFQVRNEELIYHFPIEHSSDFNSRPILISSNPANNNDLEQKIKRVQSACQVDDSFYLMTDALAYWFLSQYENEGRPWQSLRDLDTADQHQSFEEWISGLRRNKQMRNDDVTLIRLDVI